MIGPQHGFMLPAGHRNTPAYGTVDPPDCVRIVDTYRACGGRDVGDWENNDLSKAESKTSRRPITRIPATTILPIATKVLCEIDPTFSGELHRFHIGREMSWWSVDQSGRLAPGTFNRRSESVQCRHGTLLLRTTVGRGRVGLRFTSDHQSVKDTDRLWTIESGRALWMWNVLYGCYDLGDDPAAIVRFECTGDDADFEEGCLALLVAVFVERIVYPTAIPCGRINTLPGGFHSRADIIAKIPRRTDGKGVVEWKVPPAMASDVIEFMIANDECFDDTKTFWLQITVSAARPSATKRTLPRAMLRLSSGSSRIGWQAVAWGDAKAGDIVLTVVQHKESGAWDQLHVIRRAPKRTASDARGAGGGGGTDEAEHGDDDDDGHGSAASESGDPNSPPRTRSRRQHPAASRGPAAGNSMRSAGCSTVVSTMDAAAASAVSAVAGSASAAATSATAAAGAAADAAGAAASAVRSVQEQSSNTLRRLEAEIEVWRSRCDTATANNATLQAELATAKRDAEAVPELRQKLADANATIGQLKGAGRTLVAQRQEHIETIRRLEEVIAYERSAARDERKEAIVASDAREVRAQSHAMMSQQLAGSIAIALTKTTMPEQLLPAPQPVAFPAYQAPAPAMATVAAASAASAGVQAPQTGVPKAPTVAAAPAAAGIDDLFA